MEVRTSYREQKLTEKRANKEKLMFSKYYEQKDEGVLDDEKGLFSSAFTNKC